MRRQVSLFMETVVPWQTVSSLSWLLSGLLCGVANTYQRGFGILLSTLLLVRFYGMCWNRFIDWKVDARNPRTAMRALPSGRVSEQEMALYCLGCLAALWYCSSFLPPVGKLFISVALCAITLYPFLKRVTVLCHLFLGGIYALVPLAGALFQYRLLSISSLFLGVSACCGVAAADIVYAIWDIESDRQLDLHSIPARYGETRAIQMAALLYLIASGALLGSCLLLGVPVVLLVFWALFGICFLRGTGEDKRFGRLLLFLPFSSLTLLVLNRIWIVLL